MSKKIIFTDTAPAVIGPYSQAVEANGFVFVSGQLPINLATGSFAEADTAKQTEASIKNIQAILKAAGLTLDAVVKTTVFMSDLTQFAQMNEVYARFFSKIPPARSTVEVQALPKGALVEIEAVAAR
ncbi:MAG TPA: reactive intermediate/imine deaminase [Elusimicrobia bacterium]|nr:reactive intermediate/imine deaminase [Elusimicrobiota bacterium]